jgi:hypothetical protein
VLDYFMCAGGFYLGDHEGFCGGGDYDCAWQAQGSRRMDSRESCVAARGAEDVRNGSHIRTEVFEAAEDVVADSSVVDQSLLLRSEQTGRAYRDLNEPEGWSVSILRKILLLRFRIPLSWTVSDVPRGVEVFGKKVDRTIPQLEIARRIPSMESRPKEAAAPGRTGEF